MTTDQTNDAALSYLAARLRSYLPGLMAMRDHGFAALCDDIAAGADALDAHAALNKDNPNAE